MNGRTRMGDTGTDCRYRLLRSCPNASSLSRAWSSSQGAIASICWDIVQRLAVWGAEKIRMAHRSTGFASGPILHHDIVQVPPGIKLFPTRIDEIVGVVSQRDEGFGTRF